MESGKKQLLNMYVRTFKFGKYYHLIENFNLFKKNYLSFVKCYVIKNQILNHYKLYYTKIKFH